MGEKLLMGRAAKTLKLRKALMICALLGLISIVLVFVSGGLVLDHSAIMRAETLYWKDTVYVGCTGRYNEGKTIAKSSDGDEINLVNNDKSHTFVVVRSFLDDGLYVREDYMIPTSGAVTMVALDHKLIQDEALCQAMREIYLSDGEPFAHLTEGLWQKTETQSMHAVYLAYENCPVATCFVGYMGTINGQWVFTTDNSTKRWDGPDGPLPYEVICKEIPAQYVPLLKAHF